MTTIHPALLPRNVSLLRHSLQPLARTVMATRSWASIEASQLENLRATLDKKEALGILPALYATLDPLSIPSADILDALPTTNPPSQLPAAESAVITLSFLFSMISNPHFPAAATPDIWPRLCKWVEFLHLYKECFTSTTAIYEDAGATLYNPAFNIFSAFLDHLPTRQAMSMTDGVRRVLAAGWKAQLQAGTSGTRHDLCERLFAMGECLRVLSQLRAVASTTDGAAEFSEILEGCGGSREALLSVLTRTISLITASSKSLGASTFTALGLFLGQIGHFSITTFQYLLRNGIVSAWMTTLDIEIPGLPLESKLKPLVTLLSIPPGYRWVQEALRAGLLDYLVSTVTKIGSEPIDDSGHLPTLLGRIFSRSLVFYSVIVEMKEAFSRLENQARDENFIRSTLYPMWANLKVLVDERSQ
ncbi:hypothetical protein FB45DRAFT_938963 [Roridomyces roridus]|uniref:Uncharacterized protein n=1 Tax=Roridomyces roridus TaxID=1738132 RepID=A0AAD7B7S8_9AGAR|nr:hypothetical protein FB45DRAFT_938963 [Roridomyces roridus]